MATTMTTMEIIFIKIPVLILSGILIYPELKTIAQDGPATNSMDTQLAAIQVAIINRIPIGICQNELTTNSILLTPGVRRMEPKARLAFSPLCIITLLEEVDTLNSATILAGILIL